MVPKVCSIDGCGQPKKTRGWCNMHYSAWHRHGDPLGKHVFNRDKSCSIEGCDSPVSARTWCKKHYNRWLIHGDPTVVKGNAFSDPSESFRARTRHAESGCLEWTGAVDPGGYGRIRADDKTVLAHRYAWERVNGPIPAGMQVDHTCWNHACCNVAHLRLATNKQNGENREGAQKNSKSGVRGATWNQKLRKWQASVQHNGKSYYLGLHATCEEAGLAATKARAELFTHSQN